jgi:hypothetical protein
MPDEDNLLHSALSAYRTKLFNDGLTIAVQ